MLSSCGSAYRFQEDNDEVLVNRNVYPATQFDAGLLAADTSGMFGELALILKPVAVLDLPISFAVDTIILPYDIGMYTYNSRHINYWEDVSENNKTNMPMTEYLQHYDKTGSIAMLSVSRKYRNENLLKFYFNVASANDEWTGTSSKLIDSIVQTADANDKYELLRAYTCNKIASSPENVKYGSARYSIINGSRYSAECIEMLSEGASCRSLVRNKNISEKYIRKCYKEDKYKKLNESISRLPLTPVDIQESMFNYELSKLINKNIPLNKYKYHDDSISVLSNIARHTKNSTLIKKLTEMNNEYIKNSLIVNPEVPLDFKVKNENFISTYLKNSSKNKLIELISNYSDNKEILRNVAKGKRVDISVYDALMTHSPVGYRSDIYLDLVNNRDAVYKGILFKLVKRSDVKRLLDKKTYKKLLMKTEIPTITILNYGVVEFSPDGPERIKKNVAASNGRYGEMVINKNEHNIKMEKGLEFGVKFKLAKKLSSEPSYFKLITNTPDGYPENKDTKIEDISPEALYPNKEDAYIVSFVFNSKLEMIPGEWSFEIFHQDKLFSKTTFHLYK